MAKRTVPKTENPAPTEPEETSLTPEEEEEIRREEEERKAESLRPYREFAMAEKNRDELLAELMFEVTMLELA